MSRSLEYAEAADYLGVAENTLRKWVCQRKIPFIKYGIHKSAKVVFDPRDLDRFKEQNKIQPV